MRKYSHVGSTYNEVPQTEKYMRNKWNDQYLNISVNGMECKYLKKVELTSF